MYWRSVPESLYKSENMQNMQAILMHRQHGHQFSSVLSCVNCLADNCTSCKVVCFGSSTACWLTAALNVAVCVLILRIVSVETSLQFEQILRYQSWCCDHNCQAVCNDFRTKNSLHACMIQSLMAEKQGVRTESAFLASAHSPPSGVPC